MKIILLITLLCLVSILSIPSSAGVSQGKVVFIRALSDAKDSQSDVLEMDLDTGKTKLLISHELLKKNQIPRIYGVNTSSDGRFVLLAADQISFSLPIIYNWTWDRKTGTLKKLPVQNAKIDWSPHGSQLLIYDNNQSFNLGELPWKGSVQLYEPSTGKLRTLNTDNTLHITKWSRKGDGIIEASKTRMGESIVYFQPLSGKRKKLFTWPKIIAEIDESPKDSLFAIFDRKGFYIVDNEGCVLKKPNILMEPMRDYIASGNFSFDDGGTRLAIFTNYIYPPFESQDHFVEQLWWVDIKSGEPYVITQWREDFAPDKIVNNPTRHQIIGWLTDNSLVIDSRVTYKVGKNSDESRDDWHRIWIYKLVKGGNSKKVFDSGKGCLDIAWWSGKAAK